MSYVKAVVVRIWSGGEVPDIIRSEITFSLLVGRNRCHCCESCVVLACKVIDTEFRKRAFWDDAIPLIWRALIAVCKGFTAIVEGISFVQHSSTQFECIGRRILQYCSATFVIAAIDIVLVSTHVIDPAALIGAEADDT